MLRIDPHCVRITAAGALLLALPAEAIEREEVMAICEEFLLNHLDDPEWEKVCLDALAELESQLPPLIPVAQTQSSQSAPSSSASLMVGPNVNMSRLQGNHQEVTIATDPTDPDRMFTFSNTELSGGGLFAAFGTNAGASWTYVDQTDGVIADGDVGDPLPIACCDPTATWDGFGNLFISYLDLINFASPVAVSTDGGQSFTLLASLGFNTDQPTITSGAGSVWVTYSAGTAGFPIVAQGAQVTGLGTVGTFSAPQTMALSNGCNFGDIAIGPLGQVLVACQIPSGGEGPGEIRVALDSSGLGGSGFGPTSTATTTNVGGFDFIPAQEERSVDAEAGLAYDRSGGLNNGRVYLVYTDEPVQESDDFDIFVRFSDNDGGTWSNPVLVNDDGTGRSQFLPRIALDQTTGFVAVSWYDSRNDDGLGGPGDREPGANNDAQLLASVSADGGLTFLPNVQVSLGTSDEDASEPPGGGFADLDYGDYAGLAYEAGSFYPAWADNSNSTGDNPNGATTMDVYTARVLPEPDHLLLLGSGTLALWALRGFRA